MRLYQLIKICLWLTDFYLNRLINTNDWCLKCPNSDRRWRSKIKLILNLVTVVTYIHIFTEKSYMLFFLTFSIYRINSTLYICSFVLLLYYLLATSYFTPIGIIVLHFVNYFCLDVIQLTKSQMMIGYGGGIHIFYWCKGCF